MIFFFLCSVIITTLAEHQFCNPEVAESVLFELE